MIMRYRSDTKKDAPDFWVSNFQEIEIQGKKKTVMAGQPTPPNVPPPEIRPY